MKHKEYMIVGCLILAQVFVLPRAIAADEDCDIFSKLAEHQDQIAKAEETSFIPGTAKDFYNDHVNHPESVGTTTLVVLGTSYLYHLMGKRKGQVTRGAYHQAAAADRKTRDYVEAVKALQKSIYQLEDAIRLMPEEQFKQWITDQPEYYVTHLERLRKLPTDGLDQSVIHPDVVPAVVDQAKLDAITKAIEKNSASVDHEAQKMSESLADMGYIHPHPTPISFKNEGFDYAELTHMLARAKAYVEPIHSSLDDLELKLNGEPIIQPNAKEGWKDYLKRTFVPDTATWHVKDRFNTPDDRLSPKEIRAKKRAIVWRATRGIGNKVIRPLVAFPLVVVAPPVLVWAFQKFLNDQALAALEQEQDGNVQDQDKEKQLRETQPELDAGLLVTASEFTWDLLRQDQGKDFPFDFPFELKDADVLKKAMDESRQEIDKLKKEQPNRYEKQGSYRLDVYRGYWKRLLLEAQQRGDIPDRPETTLLLFGDDGTGMRGIVDTLARMVKSMEDQTKKKEAQE